MTRIARVHARQIFDSRGRPTVEVDIETDDGALGRASVPSGASTGSSEAWELRDGTNEYAGLSVRTAVGHVNGEIADAVLGHDVREQAALDKLMVELDGTAHLERLGANAILGVSLAACRAAARSEHIPLYRWVAALAGTRPDLPMPMVNILSGGLHAGRGMDVQDFLAVPASATSMAEAIEMVSRVRSAAADAVAARGLSTLLADEGGLSPGLETGRAALELMVEAIERARFVP
ncbi:MAG: phosphopyruvate hydratase, partial [Trebonia sp.]